MSGTIARRKLSDGTTVAYVVTRKNRLYMHAARPRTTALTQNELKKRTRFGIVSKAVTLVRKELTLDASPATVKHLWTTVGTLYDFLSRNGKTVTAERLAEMYAYMLW